MSTLNDGLPPAVENVLGSIILPRTMARMISEKLKQLACYAKTEEEHKQLRALIAALSGPTFVADRPADIRTAFIAAWAACERKYNPDMQMLPAILEGEGNWRAAQASFAESA